MSPKNHTSYFIPYIVVHTYRARVERARWFTSESILCLYSLVTPMPSWPKNVRLLHTHTYPTLTLVKSCLVFKRFSVPPPLYLQKAGAKHTPRIRIFVRARCYMCVCVCDRFVAYYRLVPCGCRLQSRHF